MKTLKRTVISLGIVALMLLVYWVCEEYIFEWLYAAEPVAIVTGVVTLVGLIWGLIAKKTWIVITLPSTTIFSVTTLAIVTMLLKGKALI